MAQDLTLPASAQLTAELTGSGYDMPVAAWSLDAGLVLERVEGPVTLRAYRLEAGGQTPLQVLAPLRDALQEQGFEIVLDCAARVCGGFDFYFGSQGIPAPEMFVDLANFHFISAREPSGSGVSLLASRDATAGYVQIIRAGRKAPAVKTSARESGAGSSPALPGSLGALLEAEGHVVLEDLAFASGSAALGGGPFASLDALARYVQDHPDRRILVVGHTDAVGSLEGNTALSQRRAEAAAAYLVAQGAARNQIEAQGAGYLSPRASNLSAEGRKRNRRVEAVLLPRP